jgi:hypothetical protein
MLSHSSAVTLLASSIPLFQLFAARPDQVEKSASTKKRGNFPQTHHSIPVTFNEAATLAPSRNQTSGDFALRKGVHLPRHSFRIDCKGGCNG